MLTHLEPQDPKNWEKMGGAHWRGGVRRQGVQARVSPAERRECLTARYMAKGGPWPE